MDGMLSPNGACPQADQQNAKDTLRILGLNDDPGLVRRRMNEIKTLSVLADPNDQAITYLRSIPFLSSPDDLAGGVMKFMNFYADIGNIKI